MTYRIATDDEEYPAPIGFMDAPEDPEEDNYAEEVDYYDFPESDDEGPWHDPQERLD